METIRMFEPWVSASARARVAHVLETGRISQGPIVDEFEREFEKRLGVKGAVAVNSCTSALHLALSLAGVGRGDEVITTAQTFIATSLAILHMGAEPVFADIDYLTGNLDPADVEARITDRTKAILLVHWGGRPCNMTDISAIAQRHDLEVIEDAAHSLGASDHGKPVGAISRFTCFSFQAIKHLTTGDGGMLLVPAPNDCEQARRLRWHGIDRSKRRPSLLGEAGWDVAEPGFKYQMNDIAAAMGVEHLRDLPRLLEHRRELSSVYTDGLRDTAGVTLFRDSTDQESAWWLFDIHVEEREHFVRALRAKDIETSIVHGRIDRNSVFRKFQSDLPTLDRFDATHICLPLHNHMNFEDVERVIEAVRSGW